MKRQQHNPFDQEPLTATGTLLPSPLSSAGDDDNNHQTLPTRRFNPRTYKLWQWDNGVMRYETEATFLSLPSLFNSLPDEVRSPILLLYCTILDWHAMRFVCKSWHKIIHNNACILKDLPLPSGFYHRDFLPHIIQTYHTRFLNPWGYHTWYTLTLREQHMEQCCLDFSSSYEEAVLCFVKDGRTKLSHLEELVGLTPRIKLVNPIPGIDANLPRPNYPNPISIHQIEWRNIFCEAILRHDINMLMYIYSFQGGFLWQRSDWTISSTKGDGDGLKYLARAAYNVGRVGDTILASWVLDHIIVQKMWNFRENELLDNIDPRLLYALLAGAKKYGHMDKISEWVNITCEQGPRRKPKRTCECYGALSGRRIYHVHPLSPTFEIDFQTEFGIDPEKDIYIFPYQIKKL